MDKYIKRLLISWVLMMAFVVLCLYLGGNHPGNESYGVILGLGGALSFFLSVVFLF